MALGEHLLRTSWIPRTATFGFTVAAFVILAQVPERLQATTIEQIGAFNVTYYNSGETDDGVAGQKDWTAAERADADAMIMTWTMLFGNTLATPRPIELHFIWNDLPGNTLGQSSNQFTLTTGMWRTKAERLWRTNTNSALAAAGYDTQIAFDSGTSWHVGANAPPGGQFDLRTVVLHELGHALGFVSAYDPVTDTWNLGGNGGVTEFDKHLRDAAGGGNTPQAGTTGTLGNFNQTANPVYFDGTNANAANGGGRVAIYAPTTFAPGSSLTHMDDATFPNSLMKHALPPATMVRAPTTVEVGIMQDLGWSIIVTKTWDKGNGTLNWGEGNNWDTNGVPAPTDTVAFFSNSGLAPGDTINLGGNATVGSLSFDTTVDFTLGGGSGTLTLSRGLLTRSGTSSGTQTISRPMGWAGVTNWHVDGAGQLLVSGAIGSTAGIYKTGVGVLALSGANTFSGAVTVADGLLDISNPTALGSTAAGTTVAKEAALDMSGNISVGSESLTLNGAGPSGAGALRSLSGTNSWAGNVTAATDATIGVDAGTLTLSGSVVISAGKVLRKISPGAVSVSGGLTWGAGSAVQVIGGTAGIAPAGVAAVSVADNTAQLTIGPGATVTVNGTNNDPFTDDSVTTRHVNVTNNSTAAGFQITNGSVSVGSVDGTGNTSVTLNAALAADHINQNNLTIGDPTHGAPSVTVRRSGGTPQGLDSQVSVVSSFSLANNGATIVPPPPGGYLSAIRQYFGTLDLVNNDLIIRSGSPSLFAEVQDMVRAGLFSNGARGITSSEALSSGPYVGVTWLGSIYNGFDNDNNPNTPDVPLLSSFDGVPLVGGEMLLKYTWFGDANLDGVTDADDASLYTTGVLNQDPANQAINPWLFGDFDYDGLTNNDDGSLFTTGFFGNAGAGGSHLPEPSSWVLLASAAAAVPFFARKRTRAPGS